MSHHWLYRPCTECKKESAQVQNAFANAAPAAFVDMVCTQCYFCCRPLCSSALTIMLSNAARARSISALFCFCHSCLIPSVSAVCYEEVCLLLLMLLLLRLHTSHEESNPACIMQQHVLSSLAVDPWIRFNACTKSEVWAMQTRGKKVNWWYQSGIEEHLTKHKRPQLCFCGLPESKPSGLTDLHFFS